MPRNGSGVSGTVAFPMACFANSPLIFSIAANSCILWRELMTILTMCLFTTFFSTDGSAKPETVEVVVLFLCYYFLKTQTFSGSGHNCISLKPGLFSQTYCKVSDALNGDINIDSPVSLLLFLSSPVAIGLAISFVVVFSIDGSPAWAWPHVFDKLLEIALPLRAYCNPATTIIFVLLSLWVVATVQHATPNVVKWWVAVFPRHFLSPVNGDKHLAHLLRNAIGEMNAP